MQTGYVTDLGWPELLIVAVIAMMLFGTKKMPDIARSLGRSMRIVKAELGGLRDDDAPAPASPAPAAQPVTVQPVPAQPVAVEPVAVEPIAVEPIAPPQPVAAPAPVRATPTSPTTPTR
jgi:sec-independent protein translocase protein TatA